MKQALAQLYDAGRATWPGVELDRQEFARWLEARAASVDEVHGADLYLACACARGDARAIAAFEKRFGPEVRAALGRMGALPTIADEVAQILRTKLFVVGVDGSPPKIAEYSGRGPLSAWVRVAAVRGALSLIRQKKRHAPRALVSPSRLPVQSPDPELAYIKARYRGTFRDAFRDALQALPERDRTLLRAHLIEGRSIDEIGAAHGVHRATAARWLVKARESLLGELRRQVGERLRLGRSEFDSLMGLVRSQLDVSLQGFLR